MRRNIAMKTLNKNEILSVSGGEDIASEIPYPRDGDPTLPPYIHYAEDPLVPVPIRRQPVSRNPLP
jgi:hypothetical protein